MKEKRIIKRYEADVEDAETIIKNDEKVDELLNKAQMKMKKKSVTNAGVLYEDIKLLINLLKDWISKDYREVPMGTVVSLLAGVIYFVNPFEIMPDYIPLIGYIDDAFLLSLIIRQFNRDMQKYAIWKAKNQD